MLDLQSDRIIGSLSRARALQGVSALALFVAGVSIAAPAQAQAQPAQPGDPQCPIVNRIVTCSGTLPGGVRVPAGADRDGLTVENLTADITLDLPSTTARPVIDYSAGTPTSAIRVVDADNRLSLTTAAPTTASAQNQVDRVTSAILLTANNNSNLSLLSDIDIVTRATCPFNDCVRRREILPNGITVRGSLGNFAIDNRGDISVNVAEDSNASAHAISADVFNADLVTIRNSGNLTTANAGGIHSSIISRRIEITNDGSMTLQNDLDIPVGGISLLELPVNYADGFSRPRLSQGFDFSYRIVNNGSIRVSGNGDGIRHNSGFTHAEGFESDLIGKGEIVNNGTIEAQFGMLISHEGEVTITNTGRIDGRTGMFVIQGGPGSVIARIVNTASGVIAARQGIVVDGSIADVTNAGRIEVTGDPASEGPARGIWVRTAIVTLDSAAINNSGQIVATGDGARAVEVSGNNGPTSFTNSGTITAAGADAVGLTVRHDTFEDEMPEDLIGATEVDLAATSVIRGGSGPGGAGILFFGGERNAVRNAGLITAGSGRAIVSGAAVETIDNNGRIEGLVTLGAGNDRLIARGGVITGAVDAGIGDDVLQFDVASGTAALADRIGGAVTGFELLEKTGAGELILDTLVAPRADLLGGTLRTNGALGGLTVNGSGGTALEATGSLSAVTLVNGAALSPGGSAVATLSLASLSLSGTSILRYDLGAPSQAGGADNDLINVTANITLDGVLDINAQPNFGDGVYRLINYGGTLTDNGLAMGSAPSATYTIQSGVAGQINLVVGGFSGMQFWDGGDTAADGNVDGGSGTWNNTTTNWTTPNGDANASWRNSFAIFQGAPGTVTIDAGGVTAQGLQFVVNGYRIEGGPLTLLAPATLRVGDGSAEGAGSTATIASVIQGAGGIDKIDLGTLVLGGANTYTGGTRIGGGVLQVTADNNLGAAAGGVTLDGGALRFSAAGTSVRGFTIGGAGGTIDAANALTLSGAIGGAGALTKTGAGTLTLSGNSSAFAGTTNVNSGILNLTGSLGGTLTVASGGRLGGSGTLGNLVVGSGGVLAPGNSPGTLTATGNVIFRAGSFYDLEIAAAGGRDLLAAAGTATIEGGTVRVTALDPETQYTDGTRYTFLTAAGGRSGTFTGLTENSAFLDFILGHDATSAFITVHVIRTFPDVAQTFNQEQASTALMAFNGGGADALAVYNELLLLDEAPARAVFDLASGEIYAVTLASTLSQVEGEAGRLLATAHAGSGEGWGVWGSLSGHDGEVEGDGNGGDFSHDTIRGTFGGDYRGSGNRWAVGFGGGYWKGDATLGDRASGAESDGWHLGAYARFGTGGTGFTATASGAYAQGEADVARGITAGALSRTASSTVEVEGWALAGELRYGVDTGGGFAFGPLGWVSVADGSLGRFTESGGDSFNLTGAEGNDDRRTRYGAGLFGRWTGANGSLDLTAAYLSGDDDPTEIGLALAGAPAIPYRVRAARGESEGVQVGFAGRYALGGGWSLGADAALFTGGDERQLTGSAIIAWRF